MRPLRTCLLSAIVSSTLLPLSGCGGGMVKNVFPPRASIQQLTIQPDGQWSVQLRLQNYSNVSASFASVDASLTMAGQAAGRVAATPNLRIGPESADVVTTTLTPAPAARDAVAALHGGSLTYHLEGRIVTSDPKGNYDYRFDGTLSPIPGLNGVWR